MPKRETKTDTIKERAIYVYLPSFDTAQRWKELSEKAGTSISKFVIEHVENSLGQEEGDYEPRIHLVKKINDLEEEVTDLYEKIRPLYRELETLEARIHRRLQNHLDKDVLDGNWDYYPLPKP